MAASGGGGGDTARARPYYIPGVDLQAELSTVLAPLASQNFPIAEWTLRAINENFMTAKQFIKKVRIYTVGLDEEMRRTVAAFPKARDFFGDVETCTILEFYQFCLWLRTAEGTAAVHAAQKQRRLRRKAAARPPAPPEPPEQVKLIPLFNQQLKEYHLALENNEWREHAVAAAAASNFVKSEEEGREETDDLRALFSPASGYVEKKEDELNEECWNAYLKHCRDRHVAPAELSDEMLVTCARRYGDEVRDAHVAAYLAQGTNIRDLKIWFDIYILQSWTQG